jgi:6-pyruvoyltetrahydropterin/6-carboxytetrahydropterin synthase
MVEAHLDHHLLNESLDIESPTSEAVARWVYRHLRARGLPLSAVTIEETCTSVCTYRE